MTLNQKTIKIRTRTKYVDKPTELRDNTDYWRKRLIENKPTHFIKHNQHGQVSPFFRIIKTEIVKSPAKYLEEGVLHTEKAIKITGKIETDGNLAAWY